MKPEQDWNKTAQLMGGLYPEWSPTSEEVSLWRETFEHHNQEWVQMALKRCRAANRYKTPCINDVKAKFAAVKQEQSVATDEPGWSPEKRERIEAIHREYAELDRQAADRRAAHAHHLDPRYQQLIAIHERAVAKQAGRSTAASEVE